MQPKVDASIQPEVHEFEDIFQELKKLDANIKKYCKKIKSSKNKSQIDFAWRRYFYFLKKQSKILEGTRVFREKEKELEDEKEKNLELHRNLDEAHSEIEDFQSQIDSLNNENQ